MSVKTKDKLAQTLLRIMHATDETQKFLVDLIMNEVKNTGEPVGGFSRTDTETY